ncbi:hypothetical protein DV738_g2520, partial [Chaetothyriales sp. CBS 135597]
MADRFPSIEDIDAGETAIRADAPSGNFLERERAVLGDDADLFDTTNTTTTAAARVEDDQDDLLGGGLSEDVSAPVAAVSATKDDDINGFESAFPAIDTRNEAVGPGGTITSTATAAPGSSSGGYTNYNPAVQDEEETAPVRAWREKRDADIARRDEASERKKAETVATAQKDIDSFYESYNRKVDRQKAQVAKEADEFLAKREDTTAGGTSWERVAKLVDLSGKGQSGGGDGSSKKRMRELLISLKADKDAPGAAGI